MIKCFSSDSETWSSYQGDEKRLTQRIAKETQKMNDCGHAKEHAVTCLPTPPTPKYLFTFRAATSLFLFNVIFENLILHIFLIIMIIIPCSGMFRNFQVQGSMGGHEFFGSE